MLLQLKNHSNILEELLHPETLTLNPVIFYKHSVQVMFALYT